VTGSSVDVQEDNRTVAKQSHIVIPAGVEDQGLFIVVVISEEAVDEAVRQRHWLLISRLYHLRLAARHRQSRRGYRLVP